MAEVLVGSYGFVALRGVVALIFGVLMMVNARITLAVLVLFFSAYALVNGVLTIGAAVVNRGEPHWAAQLLGGIVSVGIALLIFLLPRVTAVVLLMLTGGWSIFIGVADIVTAIQLRKAVTGEWLLALAGVLSVLFGALLMAAPRAVAPAVGLLDRGLRGHSWRRAPRGRLPAAEVGPDAGRAHDVAHHLIALARMQERCRGPSPGLG